MGKPANRLIHEKSPYLLQHAFNPVDWYPWGAAAFDKARGEDKPIFLSVGYSTCHWCHVMERESFEDPEIAALLNAHFVAIKVDREERPDVDSVYMLATQALTGQGGWPMTVFLTPDLKPFFAGTYFPPQARGGQHGLRELLFSLQRVWSEDRTRVVESAAATLDFLAEHAAPKPGGGALPDAEIFDRARAAFAADYDPAHGGFGTAPKFPRPAVLNLLLREHVRSGDAQALTMTLHTLRAMAAGGLRDHLGGGFHRYSTDARWHLPHFEKMLYDQAQLAVAYLEAYQVSGDEALVEVARETLDYVLRDLASPAGAFYSAEDADSPLPEDPLRHGEGAFYVWSAQELAEALGPDAEPFGYAYGVEADGNVGADPQGEFRGRNILYRARTTEEAAARFQTTPAALDTSLRHSRDALLQRRSRRPRPHRDDKIITAWNGLMISALARAAAALDDARYRAAAARAAQWLHGALFDAARGELCRRFRDDQAAAPAQLDDYAFLVQALLDLYEADFDARWLDWAAQLTETQLALFRDGQNGGFFDSAGRDASILLRTKSAHDGAEPAGNSVAALNLLRLAQILDRTEWSEQARRTLTAFGEPLRAAPTALPQMLVALQYQQAPPRQVVIAGAPGAADTRAMLREVQRRFLPNGVLLLADGGAGQQWLARHLAFIRDLRPQGGRATAHVCRDYVCQPPTAEPAVLARQLLESR